MIELITFTGIDERTSLDELEEIAKDYPQTEFGVLVGTKTGSKPIFPRLDLIDEIKTRKFGKAIHLCGKYAQDALRRYHRYPHEALSEIFALCEGFDRVQVNLPRGHVHDLQTLEHFVREVSCERVILQHRTQWDKVPLSLFKLEYLYDTSGGRGLITILQWPEPGNRKRFGYAGGLGPETIPGALEFAKRFPEARLWFDMEGRIRTDEYLDTDKIRAVCKVVWG